MSHGVFHNPIQYGINITRRRRQLAPIMVVKRKMQRMSQVDVASPTRGDLIRRFDILMNDYEYYDATPPTLTEWSRIDWSCTLDWDGRWSRITYDSIEHTHAS